MTSSRGCIGPPTDHCYWERLSRLSGGFGEIIANDNISSPSYQIVIEGASYRERLSPHRALLDR